MLRLAQPHPGEGGGFLVAVLPLVSRVRDWFEIREVTFFVVLCFIFSFSEHKQSHCFSPFLPVSMYHGR